MSYCLENAEAFPAGIRRVAREQLESALLALAGLKKGAEAGAVHSTRKHIKKIRALLRLVCEQIGPEIFAEENNRLREVGRSLSSARDAEVQLNVLEKLREHARQKKTAFRRTSQILKLEIAQRATAFSAEGDTSETTLQWISDRIEGWPLDQVKADDICCALQCFYRRASKGFRKCAGSKTTAETFHSWRKRVKDVWYQLLLLQNLNPTVMCELAEAAKTLGQRLGDLHDLEFFRARLAGDQTFPESERIILLALLAARERETQEIALDLGARFFAEKPKAFEKRLLRYAREWRGEDNPA